MAMIKGKIQAQASRGLLRETQIFICMSYLLSFAYLSGLQPLRKGSKVKTKYTCLSRCSVSELSNLQPPITDFPASLMGQCGAEGHRVHIWGVLPQTKVSSS